MQNENLIVHDMGICPPETAFELMELSLPQVTQFFWVRVPCSRKPGAKEKDGSPHVHQERYKLYPDAAVASKSPDSMKFFKPLREGRHLAAAYGTHELLEFLATKADSVQVWFRDGKWNVQIGLSPNAPVHADARLSSASALAVKAVLS